MKFFENFVNKIKSILGIFKIKQEINDTKILIGKKISNENINLNSDNINDYEFKVFSQFGEDGIIQYLIKNLEIGNNKFVEFGVENYEEANTRFLLENNNWAGLIIDSSEKNINFIKKQNYFWRCDVKVEHKFIDKENINNILEKNGFKGEIGLLSIDIDGNDYWIWEAIKVIKPTIVIIEYNARLGFKDSLTIPYSNNFNRNKKHYSGIYYGASINALYKLGIRKNYELVATNINGNNAFFVDKEKLRNSKIKIKKPEECYNTNSFSEFRDKSGKIIQKDDNFEKSVLEKLDFIEV